MRLGKSLKRSTHRKVAEILNGNFSEKLKDIAKKAVNEKPFSKSEIVYLLNLEKETNERKAMFELADAIRRDTVGRIISIKGIIEFSNYCTRNCAYCGIRVKSNVKRYRMDVEEIIETAVRISKFGVDTIVLQSGEDPYYTADRIVRVVKEIKKFTALPISLSIGERSVEELKMFKKAGASKYLLKQESVNRRVFEKVHGFDYDERINLLKALVSLGYITGGGNIIGLPGQSIEDVADDILFMKKIGVKMAGIGPFIPTKGTPLEKHPFGSVDLTLNTYACTRLVIPDVFLPSTTAIGSVSAELQYKGLDVGCNVIMVNFTPTKYLENYAIYDNKRNVEFYQTVKDLLNSGKRLSPRVLRAFNKIKKERENENARIL